jgi:hypothetical protein
LSKRPIALLAGALAIALIVAGCGSSSDDSTASITKAEFIEKSDAACTRGNEQIESEFQSYAKKNGIGEKKEPTEAQSTELSETILLPAVQQEVEEIRALGAPSGEEDEVNAILDAVEEGIEKGEEDPGSLVTENPAAFAKANKLAGEYGLKVCGKE